MAQARQKSSPENQVALHIRRGLRESALYIFGFSAIYFLLSLITYHQNDPSWSGSGMQGEKLNNLGGPAGAWFADVFLTLFGYLAYLLPIMVAYSGWLLFLDRFKQAPIEWRNFIIRATGFLLTLASGCGLASMHDTAVLSLLPVNAGGILGDIVSQFMLGAFSFIGGTLLLLALFLTGFTLFTHMSWFWLMDSTGRITLAMFSWLRARYVSLSMMVQNRRAKKEREAFHRIKNAKTIIAAKSKHKAPVIKQPVQKIKQSARVEKERQVPMFTTNGDSSLPALALLDDAEPHEYRMSEEALQAISRLVESKLADFGITVVVEEVHPGPVITRFELQPAPGIKVSQIVNLAKDIARSLSLASVRVVEVIPGKTTIGLEIPNEHRELIRLSENLRSSDFADARSPLTLALGKDIGGNPVVTDLAKMPHLLVAGTTGSGKSVAVNAMILSLLYNATPKDVRMIMIDPKMLELSIYDDIPHLLTPVVTDMKQAANALRWCVAEMEQRYKIMAALKVRNIAGMNRKVLEARAANNPIMDPLHPEDSELPVQELQTLPYIVVIVDELADMMMQVGKKVEELIARLAQKARASGIHLILATQRPSVDVLTGLIKSNIPSRIAFQVSSRIDSRTILDQMGAEQLLGHGDMLFLQPGAGQPTRIHGAFVDDHEVNNVVEALKANGRPQYIEEVLSGPADDSSDFSIDSDDTESDPLYDQAVKLVTQTRKASISGVQRRLKIGYNRAARMVEAMEMAGIVGPLESNGSREVIAPPPPAD